MPLETFTPADVSAMPNCHLSIHPIKLSEYDVIGLLSFVSVNRTT